MARKKNHTTIKSFEHEKRKPESKDGLKIFLIACVGQCTEPNYLSGLVTHQKQIKNIASGTEVIFARHTHSDPHGVLQDLLDTPNREQYDEFWIVIDRDPVELKGKGFGGHSDANFSEAIKEAADKNVKVACSNPCFELWIVLHFEYRDTACTRDDIQKKALEKINSLLDSKHKLSNVDQMKSIENIYSLLQDMIFTAKRNAEKLKENDENYRNPSSGMFRLLSSLISEDKK